MAEDPLDGPSSLDDYPPPERRLPNACPPSPKTIRKSIKIKTIPEKTTKNKNSARAVYLFITS
jgi:hypothetical protein